MSIWFTKAFIGAVLCKNGRWMGTLLSEEDGDGGFSFIAWKRRIVICSEVHAVSADLPFHRSEPSLDLLGSLQLTLCLMRLVRLHAAVDRRPAVIAARIAMIQYC